MTYTIGDPELARKLYDSVGKELYALKRAPRGFNRIGQGCYRVAYLHKETQTVYKVGANASNTHEAFASRKLRKRSSRKLPFDIVIPRTRTFRMKDYRAPFYTERQTVVAQQYAVGARPTNCSSMEYWAERPCDCSNKNRSGICFTKVVAMVEEWSGLDDIHSENVLYNIRDNKFWLIDMGM